MDFLSSTFYNNTIIEWAISLGIVIVSVILAKVGFKMINKHVKVLAEKTDNPYDDIVVDKVEEPFTMFLFILGYYIGVSFLTLPEGTDKFLFGLAKFSAIINFTWMLTRTISGVIETFIMEVTRKDGKDFYKQFLPLIKKGINILIWSVGIIIGLDNVGIDVTAMIAGLGVGGLALALAAQDTVKNVFGGIMIFLDKPFKMGERIQIDGFDGTVEEIGIRSTRIRTLTGRLVIIPNSAFSDNAVENVTSEPSRKIVTNIGLTYDMTPLQMEVGITTLQYIADTMEKKGLISDNHAVGFNNFGDFSLGLIFIYRIVKGEDILGVQSEINRTILHTFNEKGLEMAFPTQTLYTKSLDEPTGKNEKKILL